MGRGGFDGRSELTGAARRPGRRNTRGGGGRSSFVGAGLGFPVGGVGGEGSCTLPAGEVCEG